MIQIDISLKSAISKTRDKHLGTMIVSNDGTSEDLKRGNYDGSLLSAKNGNPFRTGHVENYPRESYNIWKLVFRMLWQMFPEEQRRVKNEIRKEIEKEITEERKRQSPLPSS